VFAVERNLTVFEARCLPNNHQFEAYDFSDFEYGERIIRTTDGQNFALMPMEDETVPEVSKILAEIYAGRLDEMERASRFNEIFGVACEPLEEKELDASIRVICPICGSSNVSYRQSNPIRTKNMLIPVITHEMWSRSAGEDKRRLIEEALRSKDLL
jgi:hypothetical protein